MHCSKLDLVIRLHEQKRTHSCATTDSKITVLFLFQISDVRLLETVNRIFTLNLYIYLFYIILDRLVTCLFTQVILLIDSVNVFYRTLCGHLRQLRSTFLRIRRITSLNVYNCIYCHVGGEREQN